MANESVKNVNLYELIHLLEFAEFVSHIIINKIMGEIDLQNIHKIYRYCVDFCKVNSIQYKFKVDDGNFETMIEFKDETMIHPPNSTNWDELKKNNIIPICPDILDYQNLIIIEYEEESRPGVRMGRLGKKGHWEESKRDERRDSLYRTHKFRLCKIWESEFKKSSKWQLILSKFLLDCYGK